MDPAVEVLHVVVVEAPGSLEPVLRVGQLRLERPRACTKGCSASACWAGDPVAAMAVDLALVTSSKTSRSCAAYPFTVSTRLGMRSYRRLSSVSMLAQALLMSCRCDTNRFRDTMRDSASSTTTPMTM